ncbi:MAG TPA: GyrI-like domain-containing protein, partial [Spirochaetia bacterium]
YAVASFKGGGDVFGAAYAYMYGEWLPSSGWQPDDAPAIESYRGAPSGPMGKERFDFDLLIPVKPL